MWKHKRSFDFFDIFQSNSFIQLVLRFSRGFKASEMITISAISKSYTKGLLRRSTEKALSNVSIAVQDNEVFGVIGPNGAGKSTLLKILMGFIRSDRGEAYINNIPCTDTSCHKYIGFLPEHPTLYPHLTPFEHLSFAYSLNESYNTVVKKESIYHVLDIVDLKHVAHTPVKRFSKGMQQRTALANALLFTPKILILDEPMSGLDPLGRQLVIDIMRDFHDKGTTIIFCSHILSDIERICDRIGILNKGKLLSVIEPHMLHKLAKPTSTSQTPLENYFLSQIIAD